MKKAKYDVPILFIGFNRPDTSAKVFEAIRKAKPKQLFISIDGPRPGNKNDEKGVIEVRKIVSNIDWDCKVKKRIHKKNVGSLDATMGALNWFFKNVEKGMVLEDDCFPSDDFFKFCEELLEKYKDDERIMHITGNNYQHGWQREKYSYYFSDYTHMWGWASWRRAWQKIDTEMKTFPTLKKKGYFKDIFPDKTQRPFFESFIKNAIINDKSAWDGNWVFTIAINNGLSIIPNKNLVQNIGFAGDGVRTRSIDSFMGIPHEKMNFPIRHPPFVIKDRTSDKRYFKWFFRKKLKKFALKKTGLHKVMSV